MQELTGNDVARIEEQIDALLEAESLPGGSLADSRWMLVTACEDMLRIVFASSAHLWTTEADIEQRAAVIHRLDEIKYLIRIALLKIDKEKPIGNWETKYFKRKEDSRYTYIGKFIWRIAKFYMRAQGVFSGIYGRDADAWGVKGGCKLFTRPSLRSMQYRLLEALVVQDLDPFTPIPILASSFLGDKYTFPDGSRLEQGAAFKAAVKSVKLRNGKISYPFVLQRIRDLFDMHLYDPQIVPQEWVFPWGDYDFSRRFFAGLSALCHMHMVCVYHGALKHGLQGGGLDQACLILKRGDFAKRISAVAGIPSDQTSRAIEMLTYGTLAKTPDLALQPFLPLAGEELLVAPLHTISSNWPRNSLTLHARIASSTFDRQSHLFELPMIEKITDSVPDRFDSFGNITLKVGRRKEEIDVVLVDHLDKQILLCECKWSIPPGDPREVNDRRKSMIQKVGQADRKLEFVRKNIASFTARLSLHAGDYSCKALVITEGFGGDLTDQQHIPVVPAAVFKEALGQEITLHKLHEIFTSPLWLPRPGIDCDVQGEVHRFAGVEIGELGLGFTSNEYLEHNLAKYLIDAAALSSEQIAGNVW
ncbi:DUF234 domain-containing protein [Qipengyuania sp. 6B39]|uniref:DUF234 domain-containing protein n=1 Tax=Qipengyuania proteolytica TaxID=2867239 RepID=UPI001C8AB7EA|nr:DUF234 domain-containing protein [Qipengyuania proteolytica]MBX7496521.1 DUF234 domain-containing protein [Qipengyuania proteolytica]